MHRADHLSAMLVMKTRYKILLLIEVVICFAPATLLLSAGVFMGLFQLAMTDPIDNEGSVALWGLIAAGLIGLSTLAYVLFRLLRPNGPIRHPAVVLAGVIIAAAPLIPYALFADDLLVFVGLLPLLSTAHALYLARHLLVSSWARIYSRVTMCALVLVSVGTVSGVVRWAQVTEDEAMARDMYAPPRPVELSATERASLDELVRSIARASRASYDSGDWSEFAALYPTGTFECWNASKEDHRFGFLSSKGIPDSAQYQIIDRRDYFDGGRVWDMERFHATHVLMINYEASAFEGCDLPSKKTWPQRHLYLTRESPGFELAHPCPSREQVESRKIAETWPVIARNQAMTLAASLSEEERQELRDLVKLDAFALRASFRLTDKYGVPESQAQHVLDAVCNMAKNPH